MIVIALLLLLGVTIISYYVRHKIIANKVAHIPGYVQVLGSSSLPIGIPFIAPETGASITRKQFELVQRYNSSVIKKVIGFRSSVMVYKPEHIRQVALKKYSDYPKEVGVYSVLDHFGPNILVSNGMLWRKHRLLCNPAFTEVNLMYANQSANTFTDFFAKQWMKGMKDNQVVLNTDEIFYNLTLHIIAQAGFGLDLRADFDMEKFSMHFKEVLRITLGPALVYKFLVPKWLDLVLQCLPFEHYGKKINRAMENLSLYIEDIVKNKRQSNDLLGILSSSDKLTMQELKSDAYIFLLAGFETTATTLTWLFYQISKNPEVQQKMIEEIDRELRGKQPSYNSIERLKYIHCVINETLRMHPPVIGIPKYADKKDVIDGYEISKGTMVVINAHAAHYNPEVWEEPTKFNPERFDTEKNPRGPAPGTFFPFSLGPRKCIGNQFAIVKLVTIIAGILQKFTVEFTPGTPKDFEPRIIQGATQRPEDVHLVFKKRE